MIEIYNMDNMEFHYISQKKPKLIFADYVYENLDFSWAEYYWNMLSDNGIFIAMTDFHSDAEFDIYMKNHLGAYLVNKLCWKNEWGHPPSKNFHMCYDMLLIYSKSPTWNFDRSKIQVPKVTAKSKGLNPSGRETKTATAWIDDCTLTTVSKERIKKDDGHLIRWQKPKKLLHRVIAPFVQTGDLIIDPFMGSGTSMEVANELGCDGIGIEYDLEPFLLAKKRLFGDMNNG